ncbi:hypothetical protein [Aestuariivirga sp.]|jgi:hypothetical protein|uniref:hypothetical protein n=1 Tax=Aestuariivirga sp. TaxID=2650926 RepID=UPI003783E104
MATSRDTANAFESERALPDTPDLSGLSLAELSAAYDFFHDIAALNNRFYCQQNFPAALEDFIDQEVFRIDHFCNAIAKEARERTCSGGGSDEAIRSKLLVQHCLNTNGGDPFIDFMAGAADVMREMQAKA